MTTLAIETQDLVRTYRTKRAPGSPQGTSVTALDGITLDVPREEFFGLLGPNGAGKTTLIKVLVTLLLPTSGRAKVSGLDVVTQAQQVRELISMVSGGEHSGYGLLTVREQLWMFSQFYGIPTRIALARIDELLKVVGLFEERNRRVSALSTGMRQKMNLVRGLVPDPEILFLDEPTVG
ncbi:MAG: ABC transporter ATP-binding protein, partial [bacterium]